MPRQVLVRNSVVVVVHNNFVGIHNSWAVFAPVEPVFPAHLPMVA